MRPTARGESCHQAGPEASISQTDHIASLVARVAARRGLPPMALASMIADRLRSTGSASPSESLLDRKATDFLALSQRLVMALGDAENRRLRKEAADAIAAGRFAEADKALAQAELHAIGDSPDLSALPLMARLLIGANRADRAAVSFLRTNAEAYREAAARYGEASLLIGLADIGRSRDAALDQAKTLSRISEDFGGREGYDEAIPALRRLLEGLHGVQDTVAFAGVQEALAAALDQLATFSGDAKLLNEAIVHCRAGLENLRHDQAPDLWRALMLRLGRLAVNLGVSQKDDNLLEEAVATYAGALAVWNRDDDEARWLEAEHMISRARAALGRRRSDLSLLERAFNGLNRVLQATDRERHPLRWAELQDQMGGVLATMGQRYTEPVVLEEAVAAFAAALEEYRQDRVPLLWAQTSANQAEAKLQLARRIQDKPMAQQALTQFMAAAEAARQNPNGDAIAADLQKRLGTAGSLAAKLLTG